MSVLDLRYPSLPEMFDSGLDDATISAYLSSVTNKDLSVAALENFLGEEKLARRNPVTGAWEGELITAMSEGGELGEALEELFSHLNKPRSVAIETSKMPWASKAGLLVTGLFLAAKISEQQAQKVYDLAGGKANPQGVSVESVAALRASYEAEKADAPRQQALDALALKIVNDFINPAKSGTQTVDEAIAAIKAGI